MKLARSYSSLMVLCIAIISCSSGARTPGSLNSGSLDLDRTSLVRDVESIIPQAQRNILELKQEGPSGTFWNLPLTMGAHYASQYYLMLHWYGDASALAKFDVARHKKLLFS